jgi:trimethylamine:corrinoid methyltransferase-like protein
MLQRYLIRQEDVEPLAEGVLIVLEKVGMLYQNEEILHSLESIGARVDRENQIATFPRRLVEEFVERLGQMVQFFYDYGKEEKRRGSKRDFIER